MYIIEETHSKKVLHVEGAGRDWTKFKVSSKLRPECALGFDLGVEREGGLCKMYI